jgi:ATP-dependent helicase/nuclease subunit A
VIDRLLLDDYSVHIIDYKTHAHAAAHTLAQIAAAYHSQMQYYADGARRLWPERRVSASLLFTRCATLWPVEV